MLCARASVLFAAVTMTVCACTPVKEIRTEIPDQTQAARSAPGSILTAPTELPSECNVGSATKGENRHMFEDYGSFLMAFAEFDDQGWSYDGDRQLTAIRARLENELKDPAYIDTDFIVVLFVHGWHHNAHDNDCNVQEARQMLRIASEQFDQAIKDGRFKRKRRVLASMSAGEVSRSMPRACVTAPSLIAATRPRKSPRGRCGSCSRICTSSSSSRRLRHPIARIPPTAPHACIRRWLGTASGA